MNIARTSNGAVLPGAAAGRAENEGVNRPSSLAARGRSTPLAGTANARGVKQVDAMGLLPASARSGGRRRLQVLDVPPSF